MLRTINLSEHRTFLYILVKWSLLGGAVGVLAGTASAVFLAALSWATAFRIANPDLLFLLPVAGFGLGWIYHRYGGRAAQGTNLVIEEAHSNRDPIPQRMAPMILIGTVVTHLFGGSAGREGSAIQMGSSLADSLRRVLGLSGEDRRWMILAGISGGFGSVFGTPVAGFVFALEVQSFGRVGYEGLIPCLVAAVVGDIVTRAWGITHSQYPPMPDTPVQPLLLIEVLLAGIVFGLASLLFIELIHRIKRLVKRNITYPPLSLVMGGIAVIVMTLILGSQDYLGLSLPLIKSSLDGTGVVTFAFLAKLIFTAVTLGTGFMGGEVTPLFVIGSTLGYTLGRLLGVDPAFMASIGFVAVFAGASNTPLACTLMGVELFGGGAILYLALGCFVAYMASGHRGIYSTQRIGAVKTSGQDVVIGESLESYTVRQATKQDS